MLRTLLAAFALLAASACSYGSAVDMAPMSARPASPIFAAGDYCEAKGASTDGPFTVISSKDCVKLVWNKATRTYTMTGDENDDRVTTAIVSLGGDLYLAQMEPGDKDDAGAPDKFQIQLVLTHGNAVLVTPVLDDAPLADVAGKHPEITFGRKSSIAREPGTKTVDAAETGRVYIAAGKSEDIKVFLREVAREAVRVAKAEDHKDEISVGIRDNSGKPDHKASRSQTADIRSVLKSFDALGQ